MNKSFIQAINPPASISGGFFLEAVVHNASTQIWNSSGPNPVNVAYHWMDEDWNMVVFDGKRTPLPGEGIPPGSTAKIDVQIDPPPRPGKHRLLLSLVKEGMGWFDGGEGFRAQSLSIRFDESARPHYEPEKTMSIVVTSDVFRSEAFGCASVAENRHWLFGFVCSALRRCVSSIAVFAPDTEGGSFDVAEYARRRNFSSTPAGWAMAASSAIPQQSEDFFDQLTGSNLVFGFGLPPSLHHLLDRHAIPYLDIEIDPVRFASELYLRARTNHGTIARILTALAVDNSLLESAAGGVRAFYARRDAKTVQLVEPFVLFVGQSPIDLSLVTCGLIAKPGDYISDIAAQTGAVSLLVKPHPYAPDNSHLECILQEVPNARLTNENIYRLLADLNLQQVVSLSSSVICEAQYFNVPSVALIENDVTKSSLIPPLARKQFRVYSQLLTSNFLKLIVDAVAGGDGNLVPKQVVGETGINLRTQLGCSWGYVGN